jgi:hypothetical protein
MATNAAPNVTPIRPNPKVNGGREIVAGAQWFLNSPRSLPTLTDTESRDKLTPEQIKGMLHDPDVYAGLMLICLMALNEKLLIRPAIEPELDDEPLPAPHVLVTPTAPANPTEQKENVNGAPNSVPGAKPATQAAVNTPADNQNTPQPATATDPPQIKPRKAKPLSPKEQLARDVSDFCQRQVNRVPKFASKMFQMVFDGLSFGNKTAEQIWDTETRGVDVDRWVLIDVKPKPYEALAFVLDPYNNHLGYIGAKPGMGLFVPINTIPDPDEIIPREKFLTFTYRPVDGDPRGNTHLDAAFNGVDMKRRGWPEYLLFMMVCAIPGILATLPDNIGEMTVYEDDGITPKIDPSTGEVIKVSGYQFVLNLLGKMRNNQVGVAPDGSQFTVLNANGNGSVFTSYFSTVRKEITMAVLLQELATKDSQHQTKNSTGQQFRVIDLLVFWVRDTLAEMIRYDCFKPLVRYNFGDEVADELLPLCSYGDTEARNWATDATAAAQLAEHLENSQWDFVTAQLGIPAPTDSEIAFRKIARALLGTMAAPGAGAGNGGGNGKPAPGNDSSSGGGNNNSDGSGDNNG